MNNIILPGNDILYHVMFA